MFVVFCVVGLFAELVTLRYILIWNIICTWLGYGAAQSLVAKSVPLHWRTFNDFNNSNNFQRSYTIVQTLGTIATQQNVILQIHLNIRLGCSKGYETLQVEDSIVL